MRLNSTYHRIVVRKWGCLQSHFFCTRRYLLESEKGVESLHSYKDYLHPLSIQERIEWFSSVLTNDFLIPKTENIPSTSLKDNFRIWNISHNLANSIAADGMHFEIRNKNQWYWYYRLTEWLTKNGDKTGGATLFNSRDLIHALPCFSSLILADNDNDCVLLLKCAKI